MTVVTEEGRFLALHRNEKDKSGSRVSRLMRKMRSENAVRPRRMAAQKIGVPIFSIGENNFVTPRPPSHTSESKIHGGVKAAKSQKSICKRVLTQIEEYCDKTTLHGLRYVGDTSLTLVERIFWLLAFTVAVLFAGTYISRIYVKWQSSPVIISFSPFDTDLSSIPFPSVTICNMNQAKKTEALRIETEGSFVERKMLNDICNGNGNFNDSEQYTWTTLRDFLIRVGSSCSDMLKICQWSNDIKNCEDLFNNDLTDEGLCCSFNRLPPNVIFRNAKEVSVLNQTYPTNIFNWNPETGFSDATDDENMIPMRPLGAGAHLGLTVVLDAQVDNYYCSSTSSVGFKILLANPIETPKMADFGTLLSPGVEARISITPTVREASDALRNIPLKKRQCYFANERQLTYYRTYTKGNCKLECLSEQIYRACKCVPYYLPKNMSMKYCEQSDDACVKKINYKITKEQGLKHFCDCYIECNSLLFASNTNYGKLSKNTNIYPIPHITKSYFESYTQRNCNLECQSNYTFQQCKCIPYFLPKNATTKQCGQQVQACVDDAKENMERTNGNGTSCSCFPGCFELKYEDSKSYGYLTFSPGFTNYSQEYLKKNIAVVSFFFPNSKFSKMIKSELYGFTEILSNIGGLLGLCMGFSFLSVVEVVYFVTLRFLCKHLRHWRNKRRATNELFTGSTYPFLK